MDFLLIMIYVVHWQFLWRSFLFVNSVFLVLYMTVYSLASLPSCMYWMEFYSAACMHPYMVKTKHRKVIMSVPNTAQNVCSQKKKNAVTYIQKLTCTGRNQRIFYLLVDWIKMITVWCITLACWCNIKKVLKKT